MSSNFIITAEYVEDVRKNKVAQEFKAPVKDQEDFSDEIEPFIITFEEPAHQESVDAIGPESHIQILEVGEDIGEITEFSEPKEDEKKSDEAIDGNSTSHMGLQLPGVENYIEDEIEETEEEESPGEPNWEEDRNPAGFMAYVLRKYPGDIPKHNGKSISGCEKAIHFLSSLNQEISEALRNDKNDVLDVSTLEDLRVSMIKDVSKLKNHAKNLQKKHRDSINRAPAKPRPMLRAAGLDLVGFDVTAEAGDDELVKEATTPRIQLVVTPFERAVTGILINSVVSAGKPFEDVYDFLKKKYSFSDREELAIMQLAQDMGYHIFKDRGTIGEKGPSDPNKQGVDFIKNYFA